MLDWVTHVPDLPVYPGGPRVGLGLWNSVAATIVVETLVFVAGLVIYARSTRAADRTGRWALWSFAAFLAIIHVANAYGPPPPSEAAVAWGSLSAWLIPLFGWWVDRHRTPATRAA